MNWVFGDFRTTIGKKCWALESKHEFDYMNGKVVANRHIAKVVVDKFKGYVTFDEFNSWVLDNIPRCLSDGTTNPDWRYYQYDGRRRDSVLYEPLSLDWVDFYAMIRGMNNPYNDKDYNVIATKLIAENNALKDTLLKIGVNNNQTYDRRKFLLDHIIKDIESALKLLKDI